MERPATTRRLLVGVIGDFDPASPLHRATDASLDHAAARMGARLETRWLATDRLVEAPEIAHAVDGIWCAPGSPYRSMDGALAVLRHAREAGLPLLGTCGGCQHVVIEFARHVLRMEDAQHAEYDPYASRLIVSELACSPAGQTMVVTLQPGSLAARLYDAAEVRERYYCNFGVNPSYARALEDGGLRVTGRDADGEPRVLEVAGHPFAVATLFVPQTRSTPEGPHPLVLGFVRAVSERAHAEARRASISG